MRKSEFENVRFPIKPVGAAAGIAVLVLVGALAYQVRAQSEIQKNVEESLRITNLVHALDDARDAIFVSIRLGTLSSATAWETQFYQGVDRFEEHRSALRESVAGLKSSSDFIGLEASFKSVIQNGELVFAHSRSGNLKKAMKIVNSIEHQRLRNQMREYSDLVLTELEEANSSKLQAIINRLRIVLVFSGVSILLVAVMGLLVMRVLRDWRRKISSVQSYLEEEIEKKSKQITAGQAALVQNVKMASLGEMAAGLAHEINNPLTIISGKASIVGELILQDQSEARDQRIRKALASIESTVERVSKIIRGMRTFARDGRRDPEHEMMLHQVVGDAVELCRDRFARKGVDLRVELGPDCVLMGQSVALSQVLINLFGNAIDALENLPEKWVKLSSSLEPNGMCKIIVADSGAGIPQSVAEKIMQPFFTTKEVGKGIGLGLSISKGIVEAHKGALGLDVTQKNTTFVIELPIHRSVGGQKVA